MKYEVSSVVGDLAVKMRRLQFDISIVADATPADKQFSTDLPGVVLPKLEGILADANALLSTAEEAEFAAESDANGVFGLVLDSSKLTDATIKKVHSVEAKYISTGTVAISVPNENGTAVARFLGATGNDICIELDSNQSLASQDITISLEVVYEID